MRSAVPTLLLPLLAACSQGEPPARAPERDPASEQALSDQIMVDPDLANQNEGNAALTVSTDHSLPLLTATPEAAAAARADAAVMVGGSDKLVLPSVAKPLRPATRDDFLTPAQFAAALPGAGACAAAMTYSAAWAARLPEALPVYPRGATLEAAGTDAQGCSLRVATYLTPVAPDDVLSFYATRARRTHFAVEHAAGGARHVISGRRGGASFRLALSVREDGLTEVTLATAGL